MQAAGVAAHEVLDNHGVLHDPQVAERHWFQLVASKRFADGDAFSGNPIHLGETPGRWWRAGPSMGEDTVATLRRRAGMSADEVDELIAAGASFIDAEPDLKLRRPYIDDPEVLTLLGAAVEAGGDRR